MYVRRKKAPLFSSKVGFQPLNYFPYNKEDAIEILSKQYGWKEYPQKHFESRFTKFYEGYWLPVRFGFDTRKVQFSSLSLYLHLRFSRPA